ncbi:MAG TPA: hypothetical protein VGS22_26920 [Thermoanaerobaculia bacterium]|jgi:hypothetical protein|nr:hypothetical protein [Thermoanaerobaculia bacterium]
MSATPRRLAFGLLVVLLALSATPAGAVPFDTGALLGKLRGFLSFVWGENGCEIEPNGRCGALTTPNGCELEPNGRCRAAATLVPGASQKPILSDNGCELEPDGRCRR